MATVNAVAIGAILFAWIALLRGDYFYDARAYWALDYDDLYGASLVGRLGTYLYSPAFAQAMWPLTLLPWPAYAALWSGLSLAVLVWMARPLLAAVLLLLPFSPVNNEISTGNLHLLIAAALVVGFRFPAAQALPLLTKVTTGVGVLWFAASRKWRQLLIALGVTAAIAAASFAISPDQWRDWIGLLVASAGVPVPPEIGVIPGPLWLRGIAAAALVLAGGYLGWRWTVPVAATLALPVTWSSGLSILVALIPLYRDRLPPLLGGRRQLESEPSPPAVA